MHVLTTLFIVLFGLPVMAGVFGKQPDILVCSVSDKAPQSNWDDLVFYLSGLQKDGSTLYKSVTSNPVLIRIDKDGMVSAPQLADCDGKSVDALRAARRAIDFGG